MRRNIYLAAAALAVTCVTAALVILFTRIASSPAAAPAATTTATSSSTSSIVSSKTMSSPTSATRTSPRSTPSSSTRPTGRVTVPKLPATRQGDPLAVAQTVVATLYSVDPAVDGDPAGAARRAAYLMTPQLAASLTAPQTTGNGAQWQDWADHGAYVTVISKKIAIAWTVADNRLRVVRNIGFLQTVHTATGATALPQQTLAVTLVRDTDDQPWRVEHMETP